MKKNMRRFAFMISIIIILIVLSGCTDKSSNTTNDSDSKDSVKQELVLNTVSEPASLDPGTATDIYSFWVIDQVLEGLYTKDKNGEPVLGAAKDVQVSSDSKTYTFTIRDDAKWSNGDQVTAEDFVYSYQRVLNPETASGNASKLYYIKGAKDYNTGTGKIENLGVQAKDSKTLIIELEVATSFFPKLLATRYYSPINKKVAEANPQWAAEAATYVSNGPFKVTGWKHDSEIIVEKNDKYWDSENVTIDKVTWKMIPDSNTFYQMYKTNELDMIQEIPADIISQEKDNPEYKLVTYYGTQMYIFNVTKAPFNNQKIRKAFSMAIDRKMITEITQRGQKPAFAMVPEGATTPSGKDFRKEFGDYFKEDIAEAKKLLAEGMAEEKLKELPPITMMYETDDSNKKVAQVIQEMLKKNLGVETKLINQEWKVYVANANQGNFQIAQWGWSGQVVDPAFNLEFFSSEISSKRTRWENAEFNQLYNGAKIEIDPTKRIEMLHQAEEIVMEESPFMPIFFTNKNYLVNPKVQDLVYQVNGYPLVRWATITK
jgi:oligopeptide transport system substrate-binding protein